MVSENDAGALPGDDIIEQLMVEDRAPVRCALSSMRGARSPAPADLRRLRRRIERSRRRFAGRAETGPTVRLDRNLPIFAARERLHEVIAAHQVVIVAGETGSGKTTQLPQFLLELGYGIGGMIGCTQPRRIAARSVAARVAEELGINLGDQIGYQVRFADQTGPDTRVKFMTDGILLAETRSDGCFERYDALIIDEAHERSLNIDFLLGYLRRVLPKRPDLKLIVTSATIDTERFSRHFSGAPVVEVSGRGYPVETRYRPLHGEDAEHRALDLKEGVGQAVDELTAEDPRGDILVFLAGERDIREVGKFLDRRNLRGTEILPLYGRLTPQQQGRVFHPGGARRIILATNVAETSLTVPGIRFVIDSGQARISRYSHRSKIQRLPIEDISQASANQRAGRCGRVGPGVCIRLYAEEDFDARDAFTEPEILRTSLASVILHMCDLGLGAIEDFPFLEPPAPRMISDGYRVLQELGALNEKREVTAIGRRLARLPMDVRLARMLLASGDEGCVGEMLTLTAGLSIMDPRLRPADAQQAADEAHARFADSESDFVALLNLYRAAESERRGLKGAAFRRWCERGYLSWLRLREWRDTRRQLASLCRELGLQEEEKAAEYPNIHRALLTGLPSHVGVRDEGQWFDGARGRRFLLHPGSGLYARPPAWVACAEIVETARVYGRTAARIEPGWVERAVPHLLSRSFADPHWSKRSGRVVARMQVSLYGLVLASGRRVPYAPVDPREAGDIFLREALVGGQLGADIELLKENARRVDEVRRLEARRRVRDLLVDEDARAAHFKRQVPAGICTRKAFVRWYQGLDQAQRVALVYAREFLLNDVSIDELDREFPTELALGETTLEASYHFEPGDPADGVTIRVPLELLNTLRQSWLDHAIPGLIADQVEALLRGLPKSQRRRLVPIPESAVRASRWVREQGGSTTETLAGYLRANHKIDITAGQLNTDALPDHLRPRLRIIDDNGREVDAGRDLETLKADHGARARKAFLKLAGDTLEQGDIRRWDFGQLPERVEVTPRAYAYPALVDLGDTVAVRLFDSQGEADDYMAEGLMRLILLGDRALERAAYRQLPVADEIFLKYAAIGTRRQLSDDVVYSALHGLVCRCEAWPRDAQAFASLAAEVRRQLMSQIQEVGCAAAAVIDAAWPVQQALGGDLEARFPDVFDDVASQFEHLIYAGFVRHTDVSRLRELPRYCRAISVRLERMDLDPERDQQRMLTVYPFWRRYLELAESHWGDPRLDAVHWRIEELRVSLFAQELGTAFKVSPKRVERALNELEAALEVA